jgi:hypothetical protein
MGRPGRLRAVLTTPPARRAAAALAVACAALTACPSPKASLPTPAGPLRARYGLRLDPHRAELRVSLRLSPRRGPVVLRLPRGRGWRRLEARLRDVRCGQTPLKRLGEQGWLLPTGCHRARWRVPLAAPAPSGYRCTRRLPVVHRSGGWMFVPGIAVLLVPHGGRGPASVVIRGPKGLPIHHALPALTSKRRRGEPPSEAENRPERRLRLRLPDLPDAPRVLLGAGALEGWTQHVQRLRIQHRAAGVPDAGLQRLLKAHPRALRYLLGVWGEPETKHLLVFWFPRLADARRVEGMATRTSVAISVPARIGAAPHLTPAIRPWVPLLTLLHEQVHQLTPVELPPWLSESLAQYYALEALRAAAVLKPAAWRRAVEAISQPWSPTPRAQARVSLLEAQRRYARTGDPHAYGLLYTNGVRFWRAVDKAIRAHGARDAGLDRWARRIVRLRYPRPHEVPPALQRLLRRAAGAAGPRLLERWVR